MALRSIGRPLTEVELAASYIPWVKDMQDWVSYVEHTSQNDAHSQKKLKAARKVAADAARRLAALIVVG